MKRSSWAVSTGIFLGAGLLLAAGCSQQSDHTVAAPVDNQAAIQKIQNDPHMPAPAKAAAIGALQKGQQAGAASAQTTGGSK